MPSRFQQASIVRFSSRTGRGELRLADGTTLEFTDAALQASAAELEDDMTVSVQIGPSSEPGRWWVQRIWLGEPPRWAALGDWVAAPEEALALLRAAGLATRCTPAEFTAACYKARFDAMLKDNDIRDAQAQTQVASVDGATTVAGLALLYGIEGPSPASLADHAFVLTDAAEDEPDARAWTQALLERWAGAPLVPGKRGADSMLMDVADRLFLREHGAGPQLYSLAGELLGGDVPFRVIAVGEPGPLHDWIEVTRYVRPDTEAAAAGVFRVGGRSLAFAEHAPACPRCREQLLACAARGALPAEFRGLLGES